jgi:hypothetical protein
MGACAANSRRTRPTISKLIRLPAWSTAGAAHTGRTLLSEWGTSLRLRSRCAGFILSDDDSVAFLEVSDDDLGHPAVGETRTNQAGLNLLGGGQDPNRLPLSSRTSAFATTETLKTTLALTLAAASLASFTAGTLSFSAR